MNERVREQAVYAWPQSDTIEIPDEYRLIVNLPGYAREEAAIGVRNAYIIGIKSVKQEDQVALGEKYYKQEKLSGLFKTPYTMKVQIDRNGITARYANGILHLVIPKFQLIKISIQ